MISNLLPNLWRGVTLSLQRMRKRSSMAEMLCCRVAIAASSTSSSELALSLLRGSEIASSGESEAEDKNAEEVRLITRRCLRSVFSCPADENGARPAHRLAVRSCDDPVKLLCHGIHADPTQMTLWARLRELTNDE